MQSARALALLGPGLDGQLAIELVRRQGCEVIAATLATPFTAYHQAVISSAERLGVELIIFDAGPGYFERIAHPRFGYTREMAPCLDCKVAMLTAARDKLAELGASFLITGDVVGQRMPGQSKRDLALVDFHARVEGKVLRPLSGQLLEPTWAEVEGCVLRAALLDIHGRSRQRQLALAQGWQWSNIPPVTSGCLLADAAYARKLRHALQRGKLEVELLPLLPIGRHFPLDEQGLAILGRNAEENARLHDWHVRHDRETTLVEPLSFAGPTALVLGEPHEQELRTVEQLLLHYARRREGDEAHDVRHCHAGKSSSQPVRHKPDFQLPAPL